MLWRLVIHKTSVPNSLSSDCHSNSVMRFTDCLYQMLSMSQRLQGRIYLFFMFLVKSVRNVSLFSTTPAPSLSISQFLVILQSFLYGSIAWTVSKWQVSGLWKIRLPLKLLYPSGRVGERKFWFDVRPKTHSPAYGFWCYIAQPSYRKGIYFNPFLFVSVPSDVSVSTVLGAEETRLGNPTAEDVVIWVKAVLRCATVTVRTEYDGSRLSIRFWSSEDHAKKQLWTISE